MSKNKWVRSISFNHKNEKDVERLKLIGKKSFSRFVKKLIDEEIKRQQSVKAEVPNNSGTPQQQQRVVPQQKKVVKQPQRQHQPNPMLQQNPMLKRR